MPVAHKIAKSPIGIQGLDELTGGGLLVELMRKEHTLEELGALLGRLLA